MHVDIAFGRLVFNWFPKSINHLMRFFRYNKFPEQIVLDHMAKLKNWKQEVKQKSEKKFIQTCEAA